MKRYIKTIILLFVLTCSFIFSGCELLFSSASSDVKKYNSEFSSSTGKWCLLEDVNTYFIFDGSQNVMTFSYTENGAVKYSGTYNAIYRGEGPKVITSLTINTKRNNKEKEDWINCYVEGFEESFTQFTIMSIEDYLGKIDGTMYTHIYRISELPYKMGTYVLEGNEYKEESNNYKYADKYNIPSGTYTLETGESFTFYMIKPLSYELFQYKNGETIVEGVFWIAEDKKTIYLYIEHDPYTKVTNADKKYYDTTFDICYPPDFYLRGDFSKKDSIEINDLYHHSESPTKVEDSLWVFGTYYK